jgi:Skp family chaperone for outer membrane proteins
MSIKTRVGWALALAVAAPLVTSAAELKVAVVSAGRILKEYHRTKQADQVIQDKAEEYSGEQEKLLAEYRKIKRDFELLRAESQNKALSEAARDKKREEAEDKLSEVLDYENMVRENTAARRKELEAEGQKQHKRLVGEIQEAVRAVAQKKGATLVLDSTGLVASGFPAVLYHEPEMDLTTEVLEMLNAAKPAAKGTAE